MTTRSTLESAEHLSALQLITLVFSIFSLLALFVQSVLKLSPEATAVLNYADYIVCAVFLADFAVQLRRAPSKTHYLIRWGWIDFLSSIPALTVFRAGRIVRIVRIVRILRAFRSSKNLVSYLLKKRKTTSMAAIVAMSCVLMLFGAVAMLNLETVPESNIKTPMDALWWSFVTVTTVGYGDRYPVTTEGRLVACLMMTVGVGLFAAFTGFVASQFAANEPPTIPELEELIREVRLLRDKIETLDSQSDHKTEV